MAEKRRNIRRWKKIPRLRIHRLKRIEEKGLNTTTFTHEEEDIGDDYDFVDDASFGSFSSYTMDQDFAKHSPNRDRNSPNRRIHSPRYQTRGPVLTQPPTQESRCCSGSCRNAENRSYEPNAKKGNFRILALDESFKPSASDLDMEPMFRMPTRKVSNTNGDPKLQRNFDFDQSDGATHQRNSSFWEGFLQCGGYGDFWQRNNPEPTYWFEGSPVVDGLPHSEETKFQGDRLPWGRSPVQATGSNSSSLFDGTLDS